MVTTIWNGISDQVQILDEAICVLLQANGKDMNPFVPPHPAIGK